MRLIRSTSNSRVAQPTDHFLKVRLQPFPDVHVIASVYFGAAVGATPMPYLRRRTRGRGFTFENNNLRTDLGAARDGTRGKLPTDRTVSVGRADTTGERRQL